MNKKSEADWQKELTPQQFNICWRKGTEPAFSSELNESHEKGIYYCVCCQSALFTSGEKFDSGSGWPSFWEPVGPNSVTLKRDEDYAIRKYIEVLCGNCGAHLGHVFDDGPPPTGKRYCINGAAMTFKRE